MGNRVGIIGYPISHSISPAFQQAALDYYSLDATYRAWEVEPQAITEFVRGLRSSDTWGANVTVPHKESVVRHMDHVDEWAGKVGAVNTIVNKGTKLTGYNTDGDGFLRALEEDGHFSPEGCRVLILGAGGSARGVALALARRGVGAITIANRTLLRAQVLAELVGMYFSSGNAGNNLKVEAISLVHPDAPLAMAAASSDLVVNCTTVGMKHSPDENRSPMPRRYIPSSALICDLVYNPPETPLLKEAAGAGAPTLGGLPMLVYQGAASFELWTGKKAPVEVMLKAAKEALA